jgi:hypothetical protein
MQLMDRGPDSQRLGETDAFQGSLLEDEVPKGVTVGPWTAVPMSVLRSLQVWVYCGVWGVGCGLWVRARDSVCVGVVVGIHKL